MGYYVQTKASEGIINVRVISRENKNKLDSLFLRQRCKKKTLKVCEPRSPKKTILENLGKDTHLNHIRPAASTAPLPTIHCSKLRFLNLPFSPTGIGNPCFRLAKLVAFFFAASSENAPLTDGILNRLIHPLGFSGRNMIGGSGGRRS